MNPDLEFLFVKAIFMDGILSCKAIESLFEQEALKSIEDIESILRVELTPQTREGIDFLKGQIRTLKTEKGPAEKASAESSPKILEGKELFELLLQESLKKFGTMLLKD